MNRAMEPISRPALILVALGVLLPAIGFSQVNRRTKDLPLVGEVPGARSERIASISGEVLSGTEIRKNLLALCDEKGGRVSEMERIIRKRIKEKIPDREKLPENTG